MYKNVLNGFTQKDKKRIFENLISLSTLQVVNYILPLITLPYLVRVLGPEKFGLIMFALAFIQYFVVFTEYGFNLSATRAISINREDKEKLSEIFISVIIVKLFIMLLSLTVMTVIVLSITKFTKDKNIYFLTFGVVFGNVLFPVWFFQGIEKMRYITVLNILAKSIFTICIFIFIREQSDYIFVPLFNSLGFLVSGLLAFGIALRNNNVKRKLPPLHNIKEQLKQGWHIFISTVSISSYLLSNTFILGLFTNNSVVGFYSAGEKLIRTLTYLFLPLFQAIYPYISRKAKEKSEEVKSLLRVITISVGLLCIILLAFLCAFSENIVELVLGKEFMKSLVIIKILSPLIVIIPLAYIFFNLAMLSFEMDRYYSKIYIFGAFLNLSLILIFLGIFNFGAEGVASANLTNEILITLIALFLLRRKGIKLLF